MCSALGLRGVQITFKVTFCSDYADMRQPSYMEMIQDAWILQPGSRKRPAGFVRGSELQEEELFSSRAPKRGRGAVSPISVGLRLPVCEGIPFVESNRYSLVAVRAPGRPRPSQNHESPGDVAGTIGWLSANTHPSGYTMVITGYPALRRSFRRLALDRQPQN